MAGGGLQYTREMDQNDVEVCTHVPLDNVGPGLVLVPEAVNWSSHQIASTNQHPIRMGTKQYIAHSASGVAEG